LQRFHGIECPPDEEPCWGFSVAGSNVESADSNVNTQLSFSTMEGDKEYFSVPTPIRDLNGKVLGGGDALPSCNNLTAEGVGADLNADNGCHWNILKVEDNVDIPLYVETKVLGGESTYKVIDAVDFKVRIRTPCNNWNDIRTRDRGCTSGERIVLFPDSFLHNNEFLSFEKDRVLIQWQIWDEVSGETLLTSDAEDPLLVSKRPNLIDDPRGNLVADNTDLTSGRINAALPFSFYRGGGLGTERAANLDAFEVLRQNHKGRMVEFDLDRFPTIQEFVTGDVPSRIGLLPRRPVLRLSMLDRPRRAALDVRCGDNNVNYLYNPVQDASDSCFNIPYLEYQFLSTAKISDPNPQVLGWTRVGDRTSIIRKKTRIVKPGGPSFAVDRF